MLASEFGSSGVEVLKLSVEFLKFGSEVLEFEH
jgi:hypothetical protein